MAIDGTKYVLIDSFTGDQMDEGTVITRDLSGARMYDVGADPDQLSAYALSQGVELFAPGDSAAGLDPVQVTELEGFIAVDTEAGFSADAPAVRLVIAPAANDGLYYNPDVARSEALQNGLIPLVSSQVNQIQGLPFIGLEDDDSE